MKQIEQELKIKSDMLTVYQALTTLKGLESWHSATIKGKFNYEDQFKLIHQEHPSFTWKIIGLIPNEFVEWECLKGPGTAPGTQVRFNLTDCDDGRILVECTHQGWSEAHKNFKKCNTLWGILLTHLKQYVETGKAQPAFK